ncbi:MAG: hypothetical protein RBT76_13610 [candidate division Zixibacteria bacterium]|jgi:hypothetical protein|nr:hypothetical protein [candidate division Zixibacteria bacterium]
MYKTLAVISLSFIGGGIAMILVANFFRTPENPRPFYHPVFLGHFGWKKEWWTPPGYVLQRIGPILVTAGFLLIAISYFMRWN